MLADKNVNPRVVSTTSDKKHPALNYKGILKRQLLLVKASLDVPGSEIILTQIGLFFIAIV